MLIECANEEGERWTTIEVLPNIIDASFRTQLDSVVNKPVKSGTPA